MRVRRSVAFFSAVTTSVLLAAVSCGGGGDGGAARPPPVSSAEDVRGAVVGVNGFGDFGFDPRIGERAASSSGSGFLVDPSGVTLTNAHVVAGADDLEVYVGGEEEPRRAEVLGTSECSDLAAIDVEGEGFSYLALREGEAKEGLPVEAAGFPAVGGDGEAAYSRTAGRITDPEADGDTAEVSVGLVLEHDAVLGGGSSGGPLVDEGGRAVGVNFGGPVDEEGVPTGYWALPASEAEEVLPSLARGEDAASLGINSRAFFDDATGTGGVYAQGVEKGSPAWEAGVRASDVILRLGGKELGADGTKAEYCDVLRGWDESGGPLPVSVARAETGEYLEGEIGGEPLRPVGEPERSVADDSERSR